MFEKGNVKRLPFIAVSKRGIQMSKNFHEEHRERVRADFLSHGFDEQTPLHKVLEMLLFYSIPRKDTNEIAHALKERFGSLEGVLEASPEELKKIRGIGDSTVAFFKLLVYITKTYRSNKMLKNERIDNMDEMYDFLAAKFLGLTREAFGIAGFNSRGDLLGFDILNEGDISSVGVSMREIMEVAFKYNASAVIIAHNHPGGNAVPSLDDIKLTETVVEALKHISVVLIDHIIVADNGDYVSLRQSSDYKYLFIH